MPSTSKTTNVKLSQFIGSDKPAWLQDYNGDMLKIDNEFAAKAPVANPSFTGTSKIPQIAGLTSINGLQAQRMTIFSGSITPTSVTTMVPGNFNITGYDELIFVAEQTDGGDFAITSTVVPLPMARQSISIVTSSRADYNLEVLAMYVFSNTSMGVREIPYSSSKVKLREVIAVKYII